LKKIKPLGDLSFGDKILSQLLKHDWPGNIRELENEVYKITVLAENGHVDESVLLSGVLNPTKRPREMLGSLAEIEKEAIHAALSRCHWNKSETADLLQIDVKTLNTKIVKYQLKRL
jgi:DNA-binding NtrC family response regulator